MCMSQIILTFGGYFLNRSILINVLIVNKIEYYLTIIIINQNVIVMQKHLQKLREFGITLLITLSEKEKVITRKFVSL